MKSRAPKPKIQLSPQANTLPTEVVDIARQHAAIVDAEGRFPQETFAALKSRGLLGALVPLALDGPGLSLAQVAAQCQTLAGACGSSAMILAMHHIQVACLARHSAANGWHADFLRRVQDEQLLLASVTSEEGIGGGMRTSICAIEREGDRFSLTKSGTAVSYGASADALLVTSRAHEGAPQGDQVMTVIDMPGLTLERKSTWDAMGMRGTGTEAFLVTGTGATAQTLPAPFAEIAAATMVPVSHILWAAVWTGIAGDAVSRARAFLRAKRKPGDTDLPHGAIVLAQAVEHLQMAEARLKVALDRFDWTSVVAPNFSEAAYDNGLKTMVSDTCLHVAREAMAVCGFSGYARTGDFSVSRHVRDLTSAPLMIGNSRMREGSARLLLAQRPQLGLD